MLRKFLAQRASSQSPTARAMIRYGQVALLYILLIFLLPANARVLHDHNLTAGEYHILQFMVTLPLVAVWGVGFYGYGKLKEYAHLIRKTPEAIGFEYLASGCMWLAWSLPVYSIVAIIGGSIADAHSGFQSASIVINNYAGLIFPLIAFTLISRASRSLFSQAKMTLSPSSMRSIMVLFIIAGVVYCYLIFNQFNPGSLNSTNNPYHLPIWLMLVTVIIPYLCAWFMGILAVYEIVAYSRQVKGVLYRQALQLMVFGLAILIIGSIALQYSSSIHPPSGHIIFNLRIVLNLLFRLISGAGFALLAAGAFRLKKIEEV